MKEAIFIITTTAIATVILFSVLSHFDKPRIEAIKKIELNTGCEYLGRAKDLASVSFFECRGVIEMRRTPQ